MFSLDTIAKKASMFKDYCKSINRSKTFGHIYAEIDPESVDVNQIFHIAFLLLEVPHLGSNEFRVGISNRLLKTMDIGAGQRQDASGDPSSPSVDSQEHPLAVQKVSAWLQDLIIKPNASEQISCINNTTHEISEVLRIMKKENTNEGPCTPNSFSNHLTKIEEFTTSIQRNSRYTTKDKMTLIFLQYRLLTEYVLTINESERNPYIVFITSLITQSYESLTI